MAMNYMVFGTGLTRARKAARALGPNVVALVSDYAARALAAYKAREYERAEELRREALRAALILNDTQRAEHPPVGAGAGFRR